jgi:GT2 family glycosyltransferase
MCICTIMSIILFIFWHHLFLKRILSIIILTPRVAIVILNWNGSHFLEKFLPGVLASTYATKEVVVADNASTDDSIAMLQTGFPQVRILSLQQNYGFAQGYNEALQQVQADYYVLLNSDVEVEPGWIEPIIELMEANLQVAACQPKILMESNHSRFEFAGASGGWIDSLGYPFARGRIFELSPPEDDAGQYDDAVPIFWASGAAMFVRAAVYHACGGLDGYFFAHMEEIDLCWRMQRAGYTIMVCPQSVVYHVGGGTLPKGNPRKVYLNFRNNLIMLWKNLPAVQLIWKLPLKFGLDAIAAWKSLLGGNWGYFIAVAKAHAGFMRWVLLEPNPHAALRSADKVTLQGYFSGSVVWAYFIKGKKKFSEIVLHKPV